jgi:hypothetical protein
MVTYPLSTIQSTDNNLLRRILFSLRNNGASGQAPEAPSNILLRQILFAIQNQTGGGGGSGFFDSSGNPRIFDSTNNGYWTLTAPNGILELNSFSTSP